MDENKELDELDDKAQAEAAEYFRELHGDIVDHEAPANENRTIYSATNEASKAQEIEDQANKAKKKERNMMYGAGAGAALAHKDVLRRTAGKLISPAPSVYAPSKPSAAPARAPVRTPAMPPVNAPITASEVDQVMQSMRGENRPTGRQSEGGHNWESNRQRLATEQNLKAMQDAEKAIVNTGPLYPTRDTGIGIPAHVAREMEEQALREAAARRVVEQRMAHEAEQRAAHEAQVAAQEEARAAERAGRNAKLMGVGKGILKVGSGALGGALAAKDAYDLYQKPMSQWTDEDYAKAVTSAGGLAMTVPTLPTEILGGLAVGAGTAYPYVKKYFKSK